MTSHFSEEIAYNPEEITEKNEILIGTDESGKEFPVTRAQMKAKGLIPNGVACILINPETRETCITKRAEGTSNAGAWQITAGHRRFGEMPSLTCTREMGEELGVKLKDSILLGKTLLENQSGKAWTHIWSVFRYKGRRYEFASK